MYGNIIKTRALGGITRKTEQKNMQISSNLKFYDRPGEFCRKNQPAWRTSQEYQLGLAYEDFLQKIVNVESNSGQNNQTYMRFWGQPGGMHSNIIDFKGQCQRKHRKSIGL